MQRLNWMTLAVIALFGMAGCSGGKSDYKKTADLKKAPAIAHEHEHGAKGPHGGSLVELGKEEYHAEVVLDHDKHALRVFILGPDAKTAQPTTAPEVTLTPHGKEAMKLKPAPQEGDGDGKASRFELIDDGIVHGLLDEGMIHAELRVTIAGTPYNGEVDYHLDDVHHEHKDEMPADGAAKEPAAKQEETKPAPDSTEKPAESPKEPEGK